VRPEVIVHHRAQAEAVLRAAGDMAVDIQLRSAPGAAGYAGVAYLKALGDAAGHELLIDCGDDAGQVMAALRAGCGKLVFAGRAEAGQRLGEMAGRRHAALRGLSDQAPPCLALPADDDGARVRPWLEQLRDR
jgi:hypothetical protein